jgi:hypothetical protein
LAKNSKYNRHVVRSSPTPVRESREAKRGTRRKRKQGFLHIFGRVFLELFCFPLEILVTGALNICSAKFLMVFSTFLELVVFKTQIQMLHVL